MTGPPFSFAIAQDLADAFGRHSVRYAFLGKCGAIILGFPGTTQDADVFAAKDPENGRRIVAALVELGFDLEPGLQAEIVRGKDFVQIGTGPFDMDLVFAPDGIESFEDIESKIVMEEGLPVVPLEWIIASKRAANREKDRRDLPLLEEFLEVWKTTRSEPR